MNIPFTKPFITGRELPYIQDILEKGYGISGDNLYTKKVHEFLQKRYNVRKALLTTSGTTALEMAIRLSDLPEGSEVIVPSFTFSSTVNAVLLENDLKVVFAEIDPKTLTIDPQDIVKKVTNKTKAVIVVHYAGVSPDMDMIMEIAYKYRLIIIEDAAQAIESTYKNKYLGTIGHFGCISFHETKNITMGEGGALFINSSNYSLYEKAEILREKGTNRNKFLRGEVDKYTWVEIGSSSSPSDILSAFLFAQLESIDQITKKRMKIYEKYRESFLPYEKQDLIALPFIPDYIKHNAHIFYVIFQSKYERDYVMKKLKSYGVNAVFHYIPLHSSPYGMKLGNKKNDLPITESISERLLRLPLYAGMNHREISYVIRMFQSILDSMKTHFKLSPERHISTYGISNGRYTSL